MRGGSKITVNGSHINAFRTFLGRQPTANFLLIVDTHSDYETGGLVHGYDSDGYSLVAPITEASNCGSRPIFVYQYMNTDNE
jgi:hypothetical protein